MDGALAVDGSAAFVDPAVIDAVFAQLRERDEVRQRRRVAARALAERSPQTFTDALDRLRVRMADCAAESREARGSAFVPLADDALTLLDGALARYEATGRFEHRNGVVEDDRRLAVLRANRIAGRTVVNGNAFRALAVPFLGDCIVEAVAFADPRQRLERIPRILPPPIVVVLPWRAALPGGEAAVARGIEHFWHIGCRRDENTLAPTCYYEREADADTRRYLHVVVEPMLATGGTLDLVMERLRTRGVPVNKIVVTAAVAAPEGVDRLLHCYPDLRIVTAALDLQLDADGYIAGPGLGDFGDLAMADIGAAYAQRHWVASGLLTADEVAKVLQRSAA